MKKTEQSQTITLPRVLSGGPDCQMYRLIRDLCYLAYMVHNPAHSYIVDREQVKYYATALARAWDPAKYVKTVKQTFHALPVKWLFSEKGVPTLVFADGTAMEVKDGVDNRGKLLNNLEALRVNHEAIIENQDKIIKALRAQLAKKTPKRTVQQLRAARKAIRAASKVLS